MDTSQNQFLAKHTEPGVVVLTFTKPTRNADAVMSSPDTDWLEKFAESTSKTEPLFLWSVCIGYLADRRMP